MPARLATENRRHHRLVTFAAGKRQQCVVTEGAFVRIRTLLAGAGAGRSGSSINLLDQIFAVRKVDANSAQWRQFSA
jgi:hypothetical protein